MSDETKKRIDEEWKSKIEKEKDDAESNKQAYYKPTFTIFVSSLTMQAMIALGKLENPLTKSVEKNKEQSRYLIDTLELLQEKTKNNLSQEEKALLDDSLFNLRMLYVEDDKKS